MKKTVFAAQVFGLMAMLPLVVILEMNHGKAVVTKRNYNSGVLPMPANRTLGWQEMGKDKRAEEAFPLTLKIFFLQKAF